jgi:quinol monooxygenase YgiN
MVFEIAEIHVLPGHEADFETAVRKAIPVFQGAPGCHGMELQRILEVRGKYRLVLQWETVEHHTVHFRNSPAFQEWRRLAGGHFASTPTVEHASVVFQAF